MTPVRAMLELAERAEQATGEDAYLDLDIYKALDPEGIGSIATLTDAPNYCGSLDAAKALVPEGWDWSTGTDGEGGGHAFLMHGSSKTEIVCDTATPALSLCAAALRARAADTPKVTPNDR